MVAILLGQLAEAAFCRAASAAEEALPLQAVRVMQTLIDLEPPVWEPLDGWAYWHDAARALTALAAC